MCCPAPPIHERIPGLLVAPRSTVIPWGTQSPPCNHPRKLEETQAELRRGFHYISSARPCTVWAWGSQWGKWCHEGKPDSAPYPPMTWYQWGKVGKHPVLSPQAEQMRSRVSTAGSRCWLSCLVHRNIAQHCMPYTHPRWSNHPLVRRSPRRKNYTTTPLVWLENAPSNTSHTRWPRPPH